MITDFFMVIKYLNHVTISYKTRAMLFAIK